MARILVVDDDPLICEVLDLFLSSDGHEVLAVAEGEAALNRLQDESVDIAIDDILMPVKEGLETIQELRCRHPDIRVIAMSGGSLVRGTDFLTMATKLGADFALRKPVKANVLRETIAECLTPHGPADRVDRDLTVAS